MKKTIIPINILKKSKNTSFSLGNLNTSNYSQYEYKT